jgi:hypothetical protein
MVIAHLYRSFFLSEIKETKMAFLGKREKEFFLYYQDEEEE